MSAINATRIRSVCDALMLEPKPVKVLVKAFGLSDLTFRIYVKEMLNYGLIKVAFMARVDGKRHAAHYLATGKHVEDANAVNACGLAITMMRKTASMACAVKQKQKTVMPDASITRHSMDDRSYRDKRIAQARQLHKEYHGISPRRANVLVVMG